MGYWLDLEVIFRISVNDDSSTNWLSLLTEAVRKNQAASSASDNEINQHAIRWFNLASDRGGGRKERAMAREAIH